MVQNTWSGIPLDFPILDRRVFTVFLLGSMTITSLSNECCSRLEASALIVDASQSFNLEWSLGCYRRLTGCLVYACSETLDAISSTLSLSPHLETPQFAAIIWFSELM